MIYEHSPFSWSRVCFCSNSWKVTSRIDRCLRIISSIRCKWSVSERRCSKPSFTWMCRFSSPAICSKYRTRTWSHLPMINVQSGCNQRSRRLKVEGRNWKSITLTWRLRFTSSSRIIVYLCAPFLVVGPRHGLEFSEAIAFDTTWASL